VLRPVTVAIAPDAGPSVAGRATPIPLPGLTERALVVVTTFIFIHQTPNAWFVARTDTVVESSNPVLIAAILCLTALAFVRVAGYLDLLISAVKLETGLFVFVGIAAASTFWSAFPVETAKAAILLVAVTLFGTYLVIRFSLDQIIRLLAVMFAFGAVVNLVFVVEFPQFAFDADGRMTGVFPHKNGLGFLAAVGMPTLLIAGRVWKPGRFAFYPMFLVLAFLLIGSDSKTMLVAAVGSTLSIFCYQPLRARKTLRGAALLGMTGIGIFTAAFATANIDLLADWLDKDVTLTGRVPLWEDLIPVAMERPLIGHGYGAAFNGYFSPIHDVWIQNPWNPSHAHNALLQLWVEMGAIAAVLFTVVYVRAVWRAISIVAIVPGAVGLWPLTFLTTTLTVSITESGMSSNRLGWMMFVVAVLSVSLHLTLRRNLGLSNDLHLATQARAQDRLERRARRALL
jgi:O-antigen ligase